MQPCVKFVEMDDHYPIETVRLVLVFPHGTVGDAVKEIRPFKVEATWVNIDVTNKSLIRRFIVDRRKHLSSITRGAWKLILERVNHC